MKKEKESKPHEEQKWKNATRPPLYHGDLEWNHSRQKLKDIIYIEGEREPGKTLPRREREGIVHTRDRRSEVESPAGENS